ncbi:hypothetical protein [Nostoc sp.]
MARWAILAWEEHERLQWITELQMQRGASMTSRDLTQENQSSIATPAASWSKQATQRGREAATLAARQTHLERARQSRDSGWERGRQVFIPSCLKSYYLPESQSSRELDSKQSYLWQLRIRLTVFNLFCINVNYTQIFCVSGMM